MSRDILAQQQPKKVRETVAALEALNVSIPGPVESALTNLSRVQDLIPPVFEPNTLRRAFADPEATRASIEALAARIATADSERAAYGLAEYDAANAVQVELRAHADTFVEALRPSAEEAIEELTWYAEAGAPDVADLLRKGLTKDAQRAAGVPAAHAKLEHLRKVRQAVSGKAFNWAIAGNWANSGTVTDKLPTTVVGLERVLDGLKAGGELWWPTVDQAVEATHALSNSARAKARQEAANRSLEFHSAI